MDWDYPQGAGPEGIFEIGRRLVEHIGRIPDATTFTNDAREMLRLTRRVEAEARGGRLFVGFQNARKLELERARYESLVAAGTQVIAFGEGQLERAHRGSGVPRPVRRTTDAWPTTGSSSPMDPSASRS